MVSWQLSEQGGQNHAEMFERLLLLRNLGKVEDFESLLWEFDSILFV